MNRTMIHGRQVFKMRNAAITLPHLLQGHCIITKF